MKESGGGVGSLCSTEKPGVLLGYPAFPRLLSCVHCTHTTALREGLTDEETGSKTAGRMCRMPGDEVNHSEGGLGAVGGSQVSGGYLDNVWGGLSEWKRVKARDGAEAVGAILVS